MKTPTVPYALPAARACLALGATLWLGACASEPPAPTLAMQSAEQAIATADRARITDESSPELHEAREKLAAAKLSVQQQQMAQAERLAQESRVDAELASATMDTAKAKAVNAEMVRGDAVLQQEMQRKDGVTQ
jgi:hypothetical protein